LSTPDGFFVQSGDLREQANSTGTYSICFHCSIPTTRLFIEPTQEEIHLLMEFFLRMDTLLLAMRTLTDMHF